MDKLKTAKQHNAEAGVMESVITCGSKDFILPPEVSVELVGIIRQAREEGKKAGIKEVVDWIKEQVLTTQNIINVYPEDLQAQLKEWGIDA